MTGARACALGLRVPERESKKEGGTGKLSKL